MIRLIICILIVLLTVAFKINAQQLYFNHLSVNNGLSQGVNNCIYRDSKGFVWISSYDGLNRFDGVNCITFRSSIHHPDGLKGTYFLNILEDQNANLWIGSDAGLNFYNRKLDRFTNFRIETLATEKKFCSPFYIDDKNCIWFEIDSQIAVFNSDSKEFRFVDRAEWTGKLTIMPFPGQLYRPLEKILVTSSSPSFVWKGGVTGTMVKWHPIRLEIPNLHITALLPQSNNNFWLGAGDGIYRFENTHMQNHISHFENKKIEHIANLHLDRKGTLWAGTIHQGLFSVDTTAKKVINQYQNSLYDSYSMAGNQVQYINNDEQGDLWVSIWGKGIDYTSLNKFWFNHHLKKEETESVGSDNFIRSIIEVNNEFWCATQAAGILILDKNKKIKSTFRKGLPMFIEYLYLDNKNQVWLASYEGLFLIDPVSLKITHIPFNTSAFSPASNEYNFLRCLENGLMLGSTNDGLFFIEKNQNAYRITPAKGIRNEKEIFLTSYTDRLNRIYVSRSFKGFGVYQRSDDSLKLLKEFSIEGSIKCFSETKDSILWIGSTIGLLRFNKNSLSIERTYTTKDNLSNHFIYGIVPDGDYLWLSTNAGINRFDVRDKTVKTFTMADGLQSNEFNTYAYYKARNGEILFGGVNGLNSFFPAEFKTNSYPPQLILTDIQINNVAYRPVNPAEIRELNTNYHENTLGFDFAVIHYANAAANTLRYILVGYDKIWITIPARNFIRYTNLPAGHYTLKVKAFSADGIEADGTYSLPITIDLPWWLSWWFKLFLVVTFFSIVVLLIRNYTNTRLAKKQIELERIQSVEKERNRISRDMHDDLGSGLTVIAILSEVVKTQLSEPEKASKLLDKIATSSRDLVDNLQDIIWVLNSKYDTLESLAVYIREYGLKFFEYLPADLEFNYPQHFSHAHLSEEQRRNLFLTVKESFNNIMKYAKCNKVTVTIEQLPNEILLSIKDDGKGFVPEKVRSYGNGLKNMKSRIELVGGSYSINSGCGKGTLTVIRFQSTPFLLHPKPSE